MTRTLPTRLTKLASRLPRRPRRRAGTPDPGLVTPGATTGRAGHDDGPLHGYPTDYYPTPATMPTSEPNRADELTWVTQQVALHAAAGTLDEGTMHLLDDQITHRLTQWHDAINTTTLARARTNDGLVAATTYLKQTAATTLAQHHDQLDRARRKYHAAHTETLEALEALHRPDNT